MCKACKHKGLLFTQNMNQLLSWCVSVVSWLQNGGKAYGCHPMIHCHSCHGVTTLISNVAKTNDCITHPSNDNEFSATVKFCSILGVMADVQQISTEARCCKKEVHRSLKSGICADEEDHPSVTYHGHHLEDKKHHEEDTLSITLSTKSQG